MNAHLHATFSPAVPSTLTQLRKAAVSRVFVATPAVLLVSLNGKSCRASINVVLPASPSPTESSHPCRQADHVPRFNVLDHACGVGVFVLYYCTMNKGVSAHIHPSTSIITCKRVLNSIMNITVSINVDGSKDIIYLRLLSRLGHRV